MLLVLMLTLKVIMLLQSDNTDIPPCRRSWSILPAGSTPPSQPAHTHLFCVSVGRSPAIYWLGNYSAGKFDLPSAAGPYPLDLGDLLYAPNVLANSKVRK